MTGRSLQILAPGLFGPMPALARSGQKLRLPRLQRALARADSRPTGGRDLESTLFALCGVAAREGRDLPVAAFQRIGDGAMADDRVWLLAHPVFLRPDQSRLLLFDFQDMALPLDQSRELARLVERHFEVEGWRLEVAEPGRWYLTLRELPALRTVGMGDVFGRNIAAFLPRGAEALRWHGLLNEIQMLLFGAAVNRTREADGQLPVNGLWLSGAGRLPACFEFPFDRLYADHPLARGMAIVGGIDSGRVADWEPVVADARSLLVYDRLLRPMWRADPLDWAEALEAFDAWLAGPLGALEGKQIDQLSICPCNGHRYRLTRPGLRRFWRRSGEYAARLESN